MAEIGTSGSSSILQFDGPNYLDEEKRIALPRTATSGITFSIVPAGGDKHPLRMNADSHSLRSARSGRSARSARSSRTARSAHTVRNSRSIHASRTIRATHEGQNAFGTFADHAHSMKSALSALAKTCVHTVHAAALFVYNPREHDKFNLRHKGNCHRCSKCNACYKLYVINRTAADDRNCDERLIPCIYSERLNQHLDGRHHPDQCHCILCTESPRGTNTGRHPPKCLCTGCKRNRKRPEGRNADANYFYGQPYWMMAYQNWQQTAGNMAQAGHF